MRVHAYTRRESPPMPVDVNKSHLTLFHRIWRRISTYCKRMLMSGTMVDDETTIPEWTREDENSSDVSTIVKDVYTRLHHTKSNVGCKRSLDGGEGDDDGLAAKQAREHFPEKRCIENLQKRKNRIAMNRKAWETIPLHTWGREHITHLQEMRKRRGSKSVFKCELITYVYYAEDERGEETLHDFYKSIRDCKSFIVWDVGSDDPGKVKHWGRLLPGRNTATIEHNRCKPIAPTGRLCIGMLTNQGQAPKQTIFDHIMENRRRYGIEALMVFVTKKCDSFLQGTLQYRVYDKDRAVLVREEDIREQPVVEDGSQVYDITECSNRGCQMDTDSGYSFANDATVKDATEFVPPNPRLSGYPIQSEGTSSECFDEDVSETRGYDITDWSNIRYQVQSDSECALSQDTVELH